MCVLQGSIILKKNRLKFNYTLCFCHQQFSQIIIKMKALFWDFDGTLIDTREKNYRVTQRIVQHVTGDDYRQFEFLQSFDNYKNGLPVAANWREIYKLYFGFNEKQIDYVGRLWTKFQLSDTTPTPLFDGIKNVVSRFSHLPMAIISQNSKASIYRQLEVNNIHNYFKNNEAYNGAGIYSRRSYNYLITNK